MLIAEDLSPNINVPVEVIPMEELEKVLCSSNNGTIVTSRYFLQPLEKLAKKYRVRAIAVDLSEDALWGFIIPFQIYTVVGIWRSANKYRGPKYWSILAKLAIIVGVISNLFSLLTGN